MHDVGEFHPFTPGSIACPERQHERRHAAVADGTAVGAGVREAHQGVFVHVQFADHVEVASGIVEERPVHEAAAFITQQGIEREAARRHPQTRGCRCQRRRGVGLVVDVAFHDPHPIRALEDQFAQRSKIDFVVGQKLRANRWITQSSDAIGERIGQPFEVRRRQQQRMRRQLHAHHDADRATCHLRHELCTGGVFCADTRESFAPELRCGFDLVEVDGHGSTTASRQSRKRFDLVRNVLVFAGGDEDAVASSLQGIAEGEQFIDVGGGAGHDFAVDRSVQ